MIARALVPGLTAALLAGCPGKSVPMPKVQPDIPTLIDHLRREQEAAVSYKTESDMEYWVDNERIKAAVPLMGKRGARLLMYALSPAGGSRLAALACDGTSFYYIDDQHNCYITGPCDASSIARMLRVRLEPDDFLLMAVGTTPVIDNPNGTIEWDSRPPGKWVVKLVSDDNQSTQTLHLSGVARQWDVLMSEKRGVRGVIEWRLTNKDFKPHKGADGATYRLPDRSRLEQPSQKGDLTVRWIQSRNGVSREINGELDTTLFTLDIPAGLAICGQPSEPPGG